MTTPVRTPGKRGRLPAKHVALKFVHQYAAEPLAAPKYPVDVSGGIAADEWLMLGNGPDPTCTTYPDGVGDCGFCGREHNEMAKAACYGLVEQWQTSNQLVTEYLIYDGGQDNGVVLADVLLYWYRKGIIRAFAPVDHTDPAAVDSAMQAFKGVICGVSLTDDAEQLFTDARPWTLAAGEQPDPDDGHVIVKVKADGRALDTYVTWGAEQGATLPWSAACLDEAWVILSTEDEVAKVNMPALTADIEALHGTGGERAPVAPAPVPVPVPADVDHESLLQELVAAIRDVAASAERDVRELLAWLASKGL